MQTDGGGKSSGDSDQTQLDEDEKEDADQTTSAQLNEDEKEDTDSVSSRKKVLGGKLYRI